MTYLHVTVICCQPRLAALDFSIRQRQVVALVSAEVSQQYKRSMRLQIKHKNQLLSYGLENVLENRSQVSLLAKNLVDKSLDDLVKVKKLCEEEMRIFGLFLKGHSGPLFVQCRLFYSYFNSKYVRVKFNDDWIRTGNLQNWKRPLCHLSHNLNS